jgi:hypothetical protein
MTVASSDHVALALLEIFNVRQPDIAREQQS